ncbi:MAG: hypothetical protein M4579_005372 [Chaenotheca gracillima]|nr:MAG: hypothetical protein M4579_005372 [Chaenotheca gracillima]
MATAGRLMFLYPILNRSLLAHEPNAGASCARSLRHLYNKRSRFHCIAPRREQLHPRHGTAVEPPSQDAEGKAIVSKKGVKKGPEAEKLEPVQPDEGNSGSPSTDKPPAKTNLESISEEAEPEDVVETSDPMPSTLSQLSQPEPEHPPRDAERLGGDAEKPLETVLHMDPPSTSSSSHSQRPPHLQAPPYVHHFDTYTLVREVAKGGFTQDQSITSMKAVRSLLAINLDVAKEGLVSKSDVENETYLFRAACSELRTEIQNNRKAETDKMRTERAQLQHEVDILNQKLTQELLTLKDDLKGMFNDRRMAVRMEQRGMESSIQELNYKITVSLNSDMKSEVEGLRWVLTRRAAMAIATMAFLILGSLRYSSYQMHMQTHNQLLASSSANNGPSPSQAPSQGGEGRESAEVLANFAMAHEGDTMRSNGRSGLGGDRGGGGPSYVSLG